MNAEEIFLNAVEIVDDQARRIYLDQVWREHPECRAEVEALLRSHIQAGSFLASPLVAPAADRPEEHSPAPLPPGTRIGPYLLQQLIGRGGMGVVYRAQQTEPVKRMVALKLIPQASSSSVIKRFESERQALAIMDHPNIARVIDAGSTEAGQPWFVMELINGIPITEYCDRARMTPRQRLELMVSVCEAIQHAHQKGIIHRDIKPSNVLVTEYDSRPVPKVIDFGIAKAIGNPLTDQSVHTDFGSVVGTLEYMSPEQAGLNQLDIDTRSDIYSLGVLIYELLTGSTPINRKQLSEAAMLEVIRVIREVEPERPSLRISTTDEAPSIAANRNTEPARLSGLVRGELDWIAMKALEKDRSRRYQTANDLAEDLQRFLQDEPVSAGPPSRWYRIRKFVRRNRAMAASAGLLLAALIAGTVGTSVGMIRAQRAGNDKEIALDQVRLERDEKSRALQLVEAERDAKNVALQAEQQARTDADTASERAVSALQTLTDETVNRLMASQPALTSQNREFINGIVAQLEQFTVTTKSSVRARVVQADGLNQIANLKARLGDDAGAVAMYRQSIEMWDRLCDEVKDKPEYRRGRADAFSNLGISLARMEEFVESEKAHRRAIEEHELLAREFPANTLYQKNVANCRNSFGVMLKDVKRNVETMEQYELAIAIYKNILAEHPEDQTAALRMGDVQNNYGLELFLAGKTDESIATFRDQIAFREKVVDSEQATPNDRSRLALSYLNLARILNQAKRADEYLSSLEKAEQISISVVDEYPGVISYREWHVNLLTMLSVAYSDQKRHDQRIAAETRKLPLIQQLVREFPGRTDFMEGLAQCHNVLAASWLRTDDPKQAEEHFELAQTSFRAVLDRDPTNVDAHFQLSNSHLALAILMRKRQNIAQAVAEFRQVLKLCESRPPNSPREAKYVELMATAQKQLDECLPLLEQE